MDAQEFLILQTDIAAQLAAVDDVFAKLEDRAQDFNTEDIRQMESVAFQIHNVYNGFEELLRLIAAHFENQISDAARWHSALLQRMTQPVPGVRPAPLTRETFLLLDALRGFRHFFRHSYVSAVDPVQLEFNLQKARQRPSFPASRFVSIFGAVETCVSESGLRNERPQPVCFDKSPMTTFTHESYLSPLTWRYGSEVMRRIWSEAEKRRLLRRVWVALRRLNSKRGW